MSTEFINDQWRLPNAWNGSESNVNKQSNYSMDFDGSSQYVDASNLSVTGDWSVSLWVNSNSTSYQTAVQLANSTTTGTNDSLIFLYLHPGGASANWGFYDGSSTLIGSALNTGQWYNLIVTKSGTTYTLFLNGTQENQNTKANINIEDLLIGKRSANIFYMDGKIDGVSIYNYALSSIQVTTLYGSSSTGIGNPMSLSPKPVAMYNLGDKSAFNSSSYLIPNSSLKDFVFSFDYSNNNYIDLNNAGSGIMDNQTSFSVSAWFKLNNNSTTSAIMANWYGSTLNQYLLRMNGGQGIQWYTRVGSSVVLLNTNYQPNVGEWIHVVGVKDAVTNGGQMRVYINGFEYSLDNTVLSGALSANNTADTIGVFSNNVSFINGSMSNVAYWTSTALTQPEVTTLYNNGSPIQTLSNIPQNSNLQAWYKLDASATYDGSNWTIEDSSSNSNDGTSSGMTQANLVQSDLSFTSGYSPYALDFDSASSDAITLGNTIGNGFTQITCSIWANISTSGLTQSSYRNFLVKFPSGSGSATPFELRSNNGNRTDSYNNKLFFRINTNTGAYGFTDTGFEFTEANKWHHLVGTYDGSNVKLFVDGVEYYSISANGTLNSNNDNALIGYHAYGNFNGKLSNASIWNTALTSSQVTEIYNEGVPSNLNNHSAYSNLVSWWQLGSNSSFNSSLNQWTCIDEKGTNTGESSQTFNEDAIVDGVGSYANGLSSGMGGDEIVGNAFGSSANSLSINMDVLDRTEDTPA